MLLQAMAPWTSLVEVEETRISGKSFSFPTTIVWAGNYVARSPYPRKFTYVACPYTNDSGFPCGKSLEFGPRCGHDLPGIPKFRFELILFDAFYAGCKPLRVNIWDSASIFVGRSAVQFSNLSEEFQIQTIQSVVHRCPKLGVTLVVEDREVNIQGFSFLNELCASPSAYCRSVTSNSPNHQDSQDLPPDSELNPNQQKRL